MLVPLVMDIEIIMKHTGVEDFWIVYRKDLFGMIPLMDAMRYKEAFAFMNEEKKRFSEFWYINVIN